MPLSAAAALLVCFSVHAENSCAEVIRLTNAVERALNALNSSIKGSKSVLHAAAHDLEIATNAARSCSDRDAKAHLAAVKTMLSDMLLAISDSAPH